jgi:hypothetical protein
VIHRAENHNSYPLRQLVFIIRTIETIAIERTLHYTPSLHGHFQESMSCIDPKETLKDKPRE